MFLLLQLNMGEWREGDRQWKRHDCTLCSYFHIYTTLILTLQFDCCQWVCYIGQIWDFCNVCIANVTKNNGLRDLLPAKSPVLWYLWHKGYIIRCANVHVFMNSHFCLWVPRGSKFLFLVLCHCLPLCQDVKGSQGLFQLAKSLEHWRLADLWTCSNTHTHKHTYTETHTGTSSVKRTGQSPPC